MRFNSGDTSINENTPLVKSVIQEQPAPGNLAQINFATVSSKDFADYIKGQSNLGVWGKTVYWSCLLGTASSIVAINSNSFVSQFEDQLPLPFIYFAISFLGLASFYTAFVTRFVSVGNYERGLENFLKFEKKGSYLELNEKKLFKIAFDRLSIFKADSRFHVFEVYDREADKKYIILPNHFNPINFKYIKKLLWGIWRDDDVQFISRDKFNPMEVEGVVPHIFHLAAKRENNLTDIGPVLSRLRLDAPRGCLPLYSCCDVPLRPYDPFLMPVKAFFEGVRFIGVRALPDMLMFSSVFTSLTNLCRLNQADFPLAGRIPLLILILTIAYVRTYVNDQFKVTEAYNNIDLIVDRIRHRRFTSWENFRFPPPVLALIISVICLIYGYSYGYRFALSGPSDMLAQMQFMAPSLQTWLASSPTFASAMLGIGNVYEDLQAISGGFFYFITGYRALTQQLWGAFYGNKKPSESPYVGNKQKWAYIMFIIANGFDNLAFAISGTYFALSSAKVDKPWNILKLFSDSMGDKGYLAFAICMGFLNALQNFSFSWYKASESMQGFFNSLRPVQFIDENVENSAEPLLNDSSSSGGEDEFKMRPPSRQNFFGSNGASSLVKGETVKGLISADEEEPPAPLLDNPGRRFCAIM